MFYDFVEIGTSDFDTQIQICPDDHAGLSIDPMTHLLERLPDKPRVHKVNCAVSAVDGAATIYYIPLDTIQAHGLPQWVRGCNSIGQIHKDFVANGIEHLVASKVVPLRTLNSIFGEFDVTSIDFLKIDTEGHDYIILASYFEQPVRAKYVEFEHMHDSEEARAMVRTMEQKGYTVMASAVPGNTLMRLY